MGLGLAITGAPMGPGSGGWNSISAPTGYTYSLPFVIQGNGGTFRAWDATTGALYDVSTAAPAGKTYYVATDGNDSNDGLSTETPLRKITTALQKADVVVVSVAAGYYDYINGWAGYDCAKSVSVIASGGRVIIGATIATTSLSWALDVAGGNTNTWKAARTLVTGIRDNATPQSNGDATSLTTQASAAAVEANPGSWYTDGTSIWVRTADSRSPDNDLYIFMSNMAYAGEVVGAVSAVTVYLENIDFVGGVNAALSIRADGSGNSPTAYLKNCTVKYSGSDGVLVNGGVLIAFGCTWSSNQDDGISGKLSNTAVPYLIEIDCTGRNNGASGDIDNGSTIHDGGSALRLNCEYCANVGPNVQDIGDGTQSWNIATSAHDSASAVNDENWTVGGSNTSATMWLESCQTSGSAVDLTSEAAATLKVRNTSYAVSDGAGTIEAY